MNAVDLKSHQSLHLDAEMDLARMNLDSSDLLRRILDRRPALVSFDVFDTLVWRPYRRPTDLFYRLGEAHQRQSFPTGMNSARVVSLRIQAEKAARSKSDSKEVNLHEIAEEFCRQANLQNPAAIAECEFLLEKDNLHPHPEMLLLMSALDREGIPLALCSDMYLSSNHLLEILNRAAALCGIQLPQPVAVLVSSDLRTGKAGGLFEILIERTGISAERILHIGDNPMADVQCARKYGLEAWHIRRTCDMADGILDAEEDYHFGHTRNSKDFGLSGARKEMLAQSLHKEQGRLNHYSYGAFIAGPIFAAYAQWVVSECNRRGIRRVHCLLREGHFLSKLLLQTKNLLNLELEVCTLLASRFCLRAVSLVDASERNLMDFLRNVRPSDVQPDLLEYIGLFSAEDSSAWRHEGLESAAWSERLEYILKLISRRSQALEQVSELAQKRKKGLLLYLNGQELKGSGDLALVDLGWGGTIQAGLLPYLRELGFEGKVHGLYLGSDHRIGRLDVSECPWQSLLYRAGEPVHEARIVQRTPELLEQFCMSSHGSLREFTPHGEPVFYENRLGQKQIQETQVLQEGVMDFTRNWLQRFTLSSGLAANVDEQEALNARLRAIISRSIDAPLAEEVELFSKWQHDSNNGSEDCRNILGNAVVVERVKSKRVTHPDQIDWLSSYWPQGLFTHLGLSWSGKSNFKKCYRNLKENVIRIFPSLSRIKSKLVSLVLQARSFLGRMRFRFRLFLIKRRSS